MPSLPCPASDTNSPAPLFPHVLHYWQHLKNSSGAWAVWQLAPILGIAIVLTYFGGPEFYPYGGSRNESLALTYLIGVIVTYYLVYYNTFIGIRDCINLEASESITWAEALPDWQRVLGICISGLLRSAAFVLALICLLSFGNSDTSQLPLQIDPGTFDLLAFLVLLLAKLPYLALFATCVMIAYRETLFSRAIPSFTAVVGAILACWSMTRGDGGLGFTPIDTSDTTDFSLVYTFAVIGLLLILFFALLGHLRLKFSQVGLIVCSLIALGLPVYFDTYISIIVFVGIGTLLLLQGLLITSAIQRPWSLSMAAFTMVLAALAGCCVFILYVFIMNAYNGYWNSELPYAFGSPLMLGFHFGLSQVFPHLSPYISSAWFPGKFVPVCFYGAPKDSLYLAVFIPLTYLAGLATWWFAALLCVKASRE